MHLNALAVFGLAAAELERGVDQERLLQLGNGIGEDVAPRDVGDSDAREVDRHALPGARLLERLIMDLDAADTRPAADREQPHLATTADVARPQRPGHDRAGATDRE